jgi:hypothetical protein
LQEIPIPTQLLAVNLSPSFDEALLRPRKAAAKTFESIQIERSALVLVVRVHVRPLMLSAGFDKHSNHNAKKPRQLRH